MFMLRTLAQVLAAPLAETSQTATRALSTIERPMPDQTERVPRPSSHVAWHAVGGKAVLLQLESGKYFSLDTTGSRIWELCDGSRNVHEIILAISQEFGAELELVENDVGELLDELGRERLLAFD
jgi:hypothetical protein